MNESIGSLINLFGTIKAHTCYVEHHREALSVPGQTVIEWEGLQVNLHIGEGRAGEIILSVGGAEIPSSFYHRAVGIIAERGIRRINLLTWGWWLGELSDIGMVRVVDHVACRLPNPLTGSAVARNGEAFINMRDVYNLECKWEVNPGVQFESLHGVILWHTIETKILGREEADVARSAGCTVVGPNVVPWVVSARAAGCEIATVVNFQFD